MKTKSHILPISLFLGLGPIFTQTSAYATSYTINVMAGSQFVANHLNNAAGNNYINNVIGPLAPLSDDGSNPNNYLNFFFFLSFDNATTKFVREVYYENDFTSNNLGPNSGNPFGPYDGWATDSTGSLAAGHPLPSLDPGNGGVINNAGPLGSATFTGTAPGGYLSDVALTGGPWNLVSCLSAVPGNYGALFGSSTPQAGHKTFVAIWNGSSFNLSEFDATTGPGQWTAYNSSTGTWDPSAEPTWSVGVSVFVKIKSGPPFVPLAAAAAPGCSVTNTILVTFSDDLDPVTSTNANLYTVTKQGGNNVVVQTAAAYGTSVVPTVKLVLLTLASSLVSGANYTVTVNGVKSLEGDAVPANSTVNFVATTTPQLVMTEPDRVSGNLLVTFDRPMDQTSAGNPANYHVVSSKGAVPTVTTATPLGPAFLPSFLGDGVRLAVGGLNSNTIYTLSVSNITSACGASVVNGANTSFAYLASNPKLLTLLSGTNLLMAWQGTNFALLQTPSLSPPVVWQGSSASLTIVGNTVTTHVPIGVGTMFFRLLLE